MRAFLAAVIVVVSASLALAERRVALVFGADRYEHIRPLNNAVGDARAIEEALDALGFEVFSESNRSLKHMRRALEDFSENASGADVAFVFFAGHGVEIAGQNMLLPTDASTASLEALKSSSLPLNELRETVAKVAKIGLIVLDACRNDPFGTISDPTGRGASALNLPKTVKPGLGRMGRAENALFAFSAAPGETASDGEGANSPFTTALTKYLGTEGLEIRSVLTLVQQEVYDKSRGTQLAASDRGNAGWQRNLSVSYDRVGDVQVAQGDLAAALASYEASLAIAERLAASDPGNAGWQWNLYVSYWRIADNTDKDEEFFDKAVSLLENLHSEGRLAPSRVRWIEITKKRLLEARAAK